jgi:predicted RNase H-like HicB family nuclease
MRKVEVRIESGPDNDWWVYCDEVIGFFAYGETREEALENAKEALTIFLDIDDDNIELVVSDK